MSTDYYLLEELLDDEARDVRDRVRTFVDTELLPVINDYWDRAEFPFPLVPKIAKLGIIGSTIEGYDCPGLSRLAVGDPAIADVRVVSAGKAEIVALSPGTTTLRVWRQPGKPPSDDLLITVVGSPSEKEPPSPAG